MSEIPVPDFIQNLTDDELRKELTKNGEKVGPITPTTRNLYKKRLLRKLKVTSYENIEKPTDPKENVMKTQQNSEKTAQTMQNSIFEFSNSIATQTEGVPESTPVKTMPHKQCFPRKLHKTPIESTENPDNLSPCSTIPTEDNARVITPPKPDGGNVKSSKLYYGICVANIDHNEAIVFENKSIALTTLKKRKNARFKEFDSFEKAREFSLNGSDVCEVKTASSTAGLNDATNRFPSLKQEDLNKLTRCIENGDISTMLDLIWKNPKYLISSADGPVTLKPNARYNALHIASKSNQAEICREILQLLHNQDFHSLLFSNMDDVHVSEHRTEHLIDSYLNTPDKILFETPLHFASKAGYKDVVRELVMYEKCSTSLLNKSNQTPLDVVCSRASGIATKNRTEIEQLLTKCFYVPLLRCHDNSESAIVGDPIRSKYDYEKFNELSSPLHSSLSVRAFAGPMLKIDAEEFRKKWVTPAKQKTLGEKFRYVRRYDCEKGDEQIGRELASRDKIGWTEFWDFMDDFVNFSTEEGLQKLENYLQDKSRRLHSNTTLEIDKLADVLQRVHFSSELQNIENESIDEKLTSHVNDNKRYNMVVGRSLPTMSSATFGEDAAMKQASTSLKMSDRSELPYQSMNKTEEGFSTASIPCNSTTCGPAHLLNPTVFKASCDRNVKPQDVPNSATNAENTSNATAGSGDVVLNVNDKNDVTGVTILQNEHLNHQDFASINAFSWRETPGKDYVQKPSNSMSVDNLYFVDSYRCASETESEILSSPSCSTISDAYPPLHNCQSFLTGMCPTKRDQDVVTAIGKLYVDPEKFPATSCWRAAVLSFSENVRRKWSTPRRSRERRSWSASELPEASFAGSPLPSSGRVNNVFSTPLKDLRRLLFKSMTSPLVGSK